MLAGNSVGGYLALVLHSAVLVVSATAGRRLVTLVAASLFVLVKFSTGRECFLSSDITFWCIVKV